MDNETRNKIVGKIETLRYDSSLADAIPILIEIVDLIRSESNGIRTVIDNLDDKVSDIRTDMIFGPDND